MTNIKVYERSSILQKKYFMYLLPLLLLITTWAAFQLLTARFGQKTGYFLGFIFYWLFWCLTVPLILIGKESIIDLFKLKRPVFGKRKLLNILLLIVPLILVYSYEFPKALSNSGVIVIFASAALSAVNATAEEILWRGTFFKIMGAGSKWFIPLSSLGFATWHFAPMTIFGNHNPGGALSFVAVSFVLGIFYSWVTQNCNSILLTTLSHMLFDFSGLGARIYF
jgi:membrane protease YdiL (CAAX protease family)